MTRTLPRDQDKMDQELALYAESEIKLSQMKSKSEGRDDGSLADVESIVSIEDRMQSFDAAAAQESIVFIGDALREIRQEFRHLKSFGHENRYGYEDINSMDGNNFIDPSEGRFDRRRSYTTDISTTTRTHSRLHSSDTFMGDHAKMDNLQKVRQESVQSLGFVTTL